MYARDFPSKAYAPRTVITRVDGTTTDRHAYKVEKMKVLAKYARFRSCVRQVDEKRWPFNTIPGPEAPGLGEEAGVRG